MPVKAETSKNTGRQPAYEMRGSAFVMAKWHNPGETV